MLIPNYPNSILSQDLTLFTSLKHHAIGILVGFFENFLSTVVRTVTDGSPPTELGNQCWQSAGFPIPLLPEDLDLKGDEKKSGGAAGGGRG